MNHMVGVRVGQNRVFSHDVDGFNRLAGLFYDLTNSKAGLGRNFFHTPGGGKLGPVGFSRHRLIRREESRQRTHIAGALDVVLAPQGVNPAGRFTNLSAEHGQVGHGENVVGAADVLGETHGVEN